MTRQAGPLFLARQSYRRRRLGDAARILPALGAVLFMAPLLGGEGHSTSGGGLWLFACWLLLVGCAAGLSRALGRRVEETTRGGPGAVGTQELGAVASELAGNDPAPKPLQADPATDAEPTPPTRPPGRS
ncbi:hypothetical protein [Frigidibacter sp. ROC022]|uniref:hypothetical protein n=1 Tax=Frigidibacter sp. ROC022 TaxID=2971796 RepID=UPI00215A7770|nr:hypothetical protein [Frigidibacter sp. ROC022]MCR8723235.1 hypothetical protein [Frigidibacter sp. ROC022]